MADETTFGIVVPTYNAALNVDRLVRSIREQTYTSYSIVIVDQESTDQTAEVARSYGCTVINSPRPSAFTPWVTAPFPAHSRNVGARAVKCRILLHLDSDMEIASPEFLKKLDTLIDSRHQAAIIREADVAAGFWPSCKALERSCYYGTEMEAARAVSRELFDRVGGYDEDLSSGEDYFITRLYERETQVSRDDSLLILHHTGRYSLGSLLKKKYVYGRTAHTYLRKASMVGGRSASSVASSSLRAYLRNWPLVFKHPALYASVLPLRAMELAALQLGMRTKPPGTMAPGESAAQVKSKSEDKGG